MVEYLVSIIIVNWNGQKWLKKCLDSVYRQTYKNIEVVLVDNCSLDGSIENVRNFYPQVKVIENNKNFGFGKANNTGAAVSKGDLLLFLNNDTVLYEDTLKKLISFKINNSLNIVGPNIIGPNILNKNGVDVYNGKKLTIDFLSYPGWGERTFYIDGCAFLISKNDFNNLGGFDDRYFMYGEDIDLCWRAQLYGMRLGICGKTSILHFGGGSSSTTDTSQLGKKGKYVTPIFRRFEVEKNILMNLLKNYKFINLLWIVPLFLIQNFFESLFYLITGNIEAYKAIMKAIYWNIININVTTKKRKIVQKRRQVGDLVIFSKMSFGINKLKALLIIGVPKFKEY